MILTTRHQMDTASSLSPSSSSEGIVVLFQDHSESGTCEQNWHPNTASFPINVKECKGMNKNELKNIVNHS
ncbi:hypothetical protein CEXT_689081 [Caerostris extrusa]|uniref:Uncharacterized protein n=1 Tax=Caerostris extrusa TaxID=172846 RepID=A0AAV4PJP1_CAEEX|nr:hypothetical protein CEXT_689081 [Caerostris extrusa]